MMKLKGRPRWEALKWIFWGSVWVTILGWIGIPYFAGFADEFTLVQYGRSTVAYVGECVDEFVESDTQGSGYVTSCAFSFEVDGTTYTGGPSIMSNDDTVIYLPHNPSIHRLKHSMGNGYLDFFVRRIGLSLVLAFMFTAPGVIILKTGIVAFINNEEAKVD